MHIWHGRPFKLRILFFPSSPWLEPDDITVEGVTNANIIVAVKKTNQKDGNPTYNAVNYQLKPGKEETCRLSHKNKTHDICKIVTHRLAKKLTVRLRACKIFMSESLHCTDYSSWQTVWTLPPRKRSSQLINVTCILDMQIDKLLN